MGNAQSTQSTLKIIIAYDDQDLVLGTYFTACKNDICNFLEEQQANGYPLEIVEIIDSRNCHTAYIDLKMADYQYEPLLFIAYSHGLAHALRCNSASYIHSDNINVLFNAWLYTNACSTAKELGILFSGNQGVFIGFDKEVRAFKQESGMMQTSINCDNCGLKYSISKPLSSVTETYKAMKSYYNQVIDSWDTFEVDVFTLFQLRRTRDALKIYGNEDLTMHDYIHKPN